MPTVAQAQRSFDAAKAKVAKLQEAMKIAREEVANKRLILANAKAEARAAEAKKKQTLGAKKQVKVDVGSTARPPGKKTVSKKTTVKQAIAARVRKNT